MTDSLEDILLRLYMFRITSLREDAVSLRQHYLRLLLRPEEADGGIP